MRVPDLRRIGVLLSAVALVAAACTGSGETTTTTATSTTSSPGTSTTIPGTTTRAPSSLDLDRQLEIDPGVEIGTLANGLTYYVRENFRPGGRAELRLVVDAGSVLEDPDQSGGAHFLEHMLFNGTERFAGNELTRVLEGFGARFGPDVNAYTSFDETVYELSIATADPDVVDLAFDVLLEWAARATIAQEDVVEERGVVLEEWRLRDAGLGGRIAQIYEDSLLAGTGYEGKQPIGDPDLLRSTDAETLRRFYEDWYRPDLMAVVAVGDFDATTVVEMIESRFGQLQPPSDAPPRPEVEVGEFSTERVAVLADRDQPTASVEMYYPRRAERVATVGDRRNEWALLLANEMIATRLSDDVTRGEAPFLSVSASDFGFTRNVGAAGFAADVASVDVLDAVRGLAVEIERARLHGYTDSEFDRVVATWKSAVEQFYAARASTQDVEYAGRYVNHYLADGPLLAAEDEYELDLAILDDLVPADAMAALTDMVTSSARATIVIGPDDGTMPPSDDIEAAIAAALAERIDPRPEGAQVGEELLAPPDPVEPVAVQSLPLGVTELEYANGVRVQYLATDISANGVAMAASSPGGMSRVADEDVAEAALVAEIVARSGAGPFDRVSLETFLADKVVFVSPYIDAVDEGLFGNAATEDLETLFQLIHLTMVAPRLDESAARNAIQEARPFADTPEQFPGLAMTLELIRQRWGDEPRYRIFLTSEELDEYDVEAAERVFAERFSDAGDFVFAFAGDFDNGLLRDYADTYLGTLPGSDRDDSAIDFQQDPPPGVVDETVSVGESEQGFVTFLFTGEAAGTSRLETQLELLALVANVKLRDRIREALSATYSPFLSMGFVAEPDQLIESFVQVSGDPAGLDTIVAETLRILEELAEQGPTEAELATAKEQLSRQYELVSNEWWIDQMLHFATNEDETLAEIIARSNYLREATPEDLRELARIAFSDERYVLVRQIPG